MVLCKPPFPMTYAKDCSYGGNDKLSCAQKARGESVVGDPINVATGTKTLVETDYIYNSAQPFVFKKYYNHLLNNWKHEYEKILSYSNTSQGEIVTISRPSFQTVVFKKSLDVWTEFKTNYGTSLVQTGNDFIYTSELDEQEYYKNLTSGFNNLTSFNLISIKKAKGGTFTLSYDANGLLSKVTDPYSNQFSIVTSRAVSGCNNIEKITSLIGIGNKTTTYTYDTSCRLIKTTYPDSTFKQYTYGSTTLIGVTDENNNSFQTTGYSFGSSGYRIATSEGLGTSGAIDKITLNYSTASQVTATDARSNSAIISYNSSNKITGYNTQCTFCIGMQGSSMSYDSNGYVSSVTDYRGSVTNYTWNSRGLMLTMTENSGGSLQRTTTYTYGTVLVNGKL